MNGATSAAGRAASADLFGHPRGLVILFLTEMWERFSYYGMRALLILYLTQHFLFSDERSALKFGAYTALVFVMTIVGGVLADRYLGARKAVVFGAVLLVLGHFGMAFEGSGSRQILTFEGAEFELAREGRGSDAQQFLATDAARSEISFSGDLILIADPEAVGLPAAMSANDYTLRIERENLYVAILHLSLALIISGVGFLKANISAIVGALYEFSDRRRDAGFTIYYMGINLGAFAAGIVCGYLGITYGWKYGFGLAGVGMTLGLTIFLIGKPWLEGKAEPPDPAKLKERVLGFLTVETACYCCGLAMIAVSAFLIMNARLVGGVLGPVAAIMLAYLLWFAIFRTAREERDRMLVAIYFILAQAPFWALFEQAGSSLNLFTDRLVDRTIFGIGVPAPLFQSVGSGFLILFAPLVAWLWIWLARRGREPSAPVKFSLGMFLLGGGFFALAAGMKLSGAEGLTAVIFIFLVYLLHALGELLVSPVGLSGVTKLAPARIVATTMGAWFLFTGVSNFLAGVVARAASVDTIGGQITNIAEAKATYAVVYLNLAWFAAGVAALMLIVSPFLKRMIHDR